MIVVAKVPSTIWLCVCFLFVFYAQKVFCVWTRETHRVVCVFLLRFASIPFYILYIYCICVYCANLWCGWIAHQRIVSNLSKARDLITNPRILCFLPIEWSIDRSVRCTQNYRSICVWSSILNKLCFNFRIQTSYL